LKICLVVLYFTSPCASMLSPVSWSNCRLAILLRSLCTSRWSKDCDDEQSMGQVLTKWKLVGKFSFWGKKITDLKSLKIKSEGNITYFKKFGIVRGLTKL
jgi:hypothetical protein